jgi:predicted PurR-regulated permease PerM
MVGESIACNVTLEKIECASSYSLSLQGEKQSCTVGFHSFTNLIVFVWLSIGLWNYLSTNFVAILIYYSLNAYQITLLRGRQINNTWSNTVKVFFSFALFISIFFNRLNFIKGQITLTKSIRDWRKTSKRSWKFKMD